MSETPFETLFVKLDFIILERTDSGELVPRTGAPPWFTDAARTAAGDGVATLGGTLPFLDHLRTEADRFWWSGADGVQSGEPFAIQGAAEEYLIRPRVVTVERRKLLLLERLIGAADSRPMLQTAREDRLEHERMTMHAADLGPPIDAIARMATHLIESDLSPASQETARGVLRAAEQARAALRLLTDPSRSGA